MLPKQLNPSGGGDNPRHSAVARGRRAVKTPVSNRDRQAKPSARDRGDKPLWTKYHLVSFVVAQGAAYPVTDVDRSLERRLHPPFCVQCNIRCIMGLSVGDKMSSVTNYPPSCAARALESLTPPARHVQLAAGGHRACSANHLVNGVVDRRDRNIRSKSITL